ncbi:MAG: GNAT family N-acetyltransferase [Bacteroidia bacterium]|nr:GNAT family N-acetyltransferase [Bacteroidia bacterium]
MQIDFNTNYVLEDNIAKLVPLTPGDYAHMLPYALNEPELWDYSTQPGDGARNMKQYLDSALLGRASGQQYPFAVIDKRSNAFAGSTRFYNIQLEHETLELGYTWYGKAFQGTGLNKHCKYLMLQFAFEKLESMRVEFRADARNTRSIAAMKSIGCTLEGTLRSHMPASDGHRRDSVILSILKQEWEGGVKERLYRKCYGETGKEGA